jgi:glycosyltransferase involved in cell wall biosynthesis
MSRIVTVYSPELRSRPAVEMGYIRWHRMSAALASLGHTVDIASAELRRRVFRTIEPVAPNLRIVPISQVRWREYDAVKTHYHHGFQTLERYGGANHQFLIAHLGSVVGRTDMEGIFFYGRRREELYRVQERIDRVSRYVSLLSAPAERLWRSCFQTDRNILLVPGAASAEIPGPRRSPYPRGGRSPCVFVGSLYNRKRSSQPEAHRRLANKLNRLGALLHERGARLYVVGAGDDRSLNRRFVTYCGAVPYEDSWDYIHFAAVGTVLTAGGPMHNNESTKIYHYLRAGLPVVSEAGFPNDNVVLESGLGHVVENGALDVMAERILEAAHASWDRERAIRYILDNHTWEKRAEIYDRILRSAPVT